MLRRRKSVKSAHIGRSSGIGSRTALKTAYGPVLAARSMRNVVRKCHIAIDIWSLRNCGSEKVLDSPVSLVLLRSGIEIAHLVQEYGHYCRDRIEGHVDVFRKGGSCRLM